MRRRVSGLRWWGGKWWCSRWFSGMWRHSSLVGLVVSLWVCLVTLAHLSLQPSPLVSQQPCQQGSIPGTHEGVLGSSSWSMGVGPHQEREWGVLGVEGILHERQAAVGTKDGFVGREPLSRLPAKVGPDQRVLLTNEDTLDDVENDLAHDFGAEAVQQNAENHVKHDDFSLAGFSAKTFSANRKAEIFLGNKVSSSFSSRYFKQSGRSIVDGTDASENAQETQLERAPMSRLVEADSKSLPSRHQLPDHPNNSPDLDMRHIMNPRYPSGVRDNTPGEEASQVTHGYPVVFDHRHTSQDSHRSRKTRKQNPSEPADSSFVLAQSQSHLTRKNHDTIREVGHKRSESAVPSAASRGLPHKALALDTEDDAIAVGTRLKKDGFLLYAYNVSASDALPMDREVPDTRPEGCPRQLPNMTSMGPVSVVICTHNEAPSVLRRTVFSVLMRTPPHLLRDVIVVDDNSTLGDPEKALEVIDEEVKQGKLRLLRTQGRQGLVRARLLGAQAATGRVLVFLDSHCECGPDWLPPLLDALAQDRKKIVSPYIDVIRSESFAYARSPDNLQGSFNWRLEFGWRAIPLADLKRRLGPHLPINTPVISGGLFAVERQFFFDIGSYDEHMDIWGGENMELSFRVWMCGGRLEILPCSRVGHVFRSSVPYSFPGDRRRTVLRNLARAARVWMDDYSSVFFAAVNMTSSYDVGNVTSREALRERLQCRSFEWYLRTVSSYLQVPSPLTLQYGQFKNRGSLLCLTSSSGSVSSHNLSLVACHGSENQTVELLKTGDLQVRGSCVVPAANKQLTLTPCQGHGPRWTMKGGQIYLDTTDLCLTSVDNEFVRLQTCQPGDSFQLWEPSYTFTWPQ